MEGADLQFLANYYKTEEFELEILKNGYQNCIPQLMAINAWKRQATPSFRAGQRHHAPHQLPGLPSRCARREDSQVYKRCSRYASQNILQRHVPPRTTADARRRGRWSVCTRKGLKRGFVLLLSVENAPRKLNQSPCDSFHSPPSKRITGALRCSASCVCA